MYELLGERTAADDEKPSKKKEKKEKPAKVEVSITTCFSYIYMRVFCDIIFLDTSLYYTVVETCC